MVVCMTHISYGYHMEQHFAALVYILKLIGKKMEIYHIKMQLATELTIKAYLSLSV